MASVRAISNASVQQTPGFSQEQVARLQAVRLQQTPQTTISIAPKPAVKEDMPFVLYAAAVPARLTLMLANAADNFFGPKGQKPQGLNVFA